MVLLSVLAPMLLPTPPVATSRVFGYPCFLKIYFNLGRIHDFYLTFVFTYLLSSNYLKVRCTETWTVKYLLSVASLPK